jgi:hypothetical protein
MTWSDRLGAVGVWRGVNDLNPAMARTIEELGFGTIWQGGSPGPDLRAAEELLDATESLHLATGIVNIWKSIRPSSLTPTTASRPDIRGGCCLALGPVTVRRHRGGYARSMLWPRISTSWTSTACRSRPGCLRR